MISISPVTRIEGHLGVNLETEEGRISNARVVGEMFRGFEVILRGRDPLDAQRITQSICGVCPIEHGTASVFAQDAAYGIRVPPNGRLTRNLIQAANILASHLTHFYLLSGLDFANVAGVLDYTGSDPALVHLRKFAQTQSAGTGKHRGLVAPVGPFLPQLGSSLLCKDQNVNLQLLRHYCQVVGVQSVGLKAIAQKMVAVFGARVPHSTALIPGGITDQVTAMKIEQYRGFLEQVSDFIDNAYWGDVLAAAGCFPEYFEIGRGPGNYLAYGVFPEDDGQRFLPGGTVMQGNLGKVDITAISEDVKHSWFRSASGLHPTKGETKPDPEKTGAYSWLKAPRYKGQVMEVGALARMMVAYHSGHQGVKASVDLVLRTAGRQPADLNSVLGRHAARAIEAKLVVARCHEWLDMLRPGEPTSVDFSIPDACEGMGLTEAARGALGHWIRVKGGKIDNYQCVVPTTWNCSPRDDNDQPGALEQALIGTPNVDPEEPIEAMRVVRSFDPCLACAVH